MSPRRRTPGGLALKLGIQSPWQSPVQAVLAQPLHHAQLQICPPMFRSRLRRTLCQ